MENFITLKVANTPLELASFPLKQSIYLESSVELEDSLIKDNIVLIRNVEEYGLVNAGDLYNYNIGYVKESFSTIEMDIVAYVEEGIHKLKCIPKEPLSPNSSYVLYIDKKLSKEYISIVKTVSKGPSTLILDTSVIGDNPTGNFTLKVMSSPKITATMNIIKFQVFEDGAPGRYFTINAKSSDNKIEYGGFRVTVPDTAFGLDEEFAIVLKDSHINLKESLILEIKTAISSKITVVENIKESSSISNADILAYYAGLDNASAQITTEGSINFTNSGWQTSEYKIEYLDEDKFMLSLNNLTVDNLDLDVISYREFPCYNKYDIKALNLYDVEDKYVLEYEIIDDKNVLFLVVKEAL